MGSGWSGFRKFSNSWVRGVGGGVRQGEVYRCGKVVSAVAPGVEHAREKDVAGAGGGNFFDLRRRDGGERTGAIAELDGAGAVGDDPALRGGVGGEMGEIGGEGAEFVGVNFNESHRARDEPRERRAISIGDEGSAGDPEGEGGAEYIEVGRSPARETTAEREGETGGLSIEKICAGAERGGVRRGVGAEEGRLGLAGGADDGAGAGGRGGRKGAEGEARATEPREAVVAGGAAGEAEGGVGRAEAREHFGDVDALAADLEGFGGGALRAAGAPSGEREGALGEEVAREGK